MERRLPRRQLEALTSDRDRLNEVVRVAGWPPAAALLALFDDAVRDGAVVVRNSRVQPVTTFLPRALLGQWYYEVPRWLGGDPSKGETHLRRALAYDPTNLVALLFLAERLASSRRLDEARELLRRIADAPLSTQFAPEDRDTKQRAADFLSALRNKL